MERLEDRLYPGDTLLGFLAMAWWASAFAAGEESAPAAPTQRHEESISRRLSAMVPVGQTTSLSVLPNIQPQESLRARDPLGTETSLAPGGALDLTLFADPLLVEQIAHHRLGASPSADVPRPPATASALSMAAAMGSSRESGAETLPVRSDTVMATGSAGTSGIGWAAVRPIDGVHLAFNRAEGQLLIYASSGAHTVQEAPTADGFIQIRVDGQSQTSNPHATTFDSALAGVSTATLTGLHLVGSGQDTLILGTQQLAHGLTVEAAGATVITQQIVTAGSLTIQAANLTIRDHLQGSTITLAVTNDLMVEAAGRIDVTTGTSGGTLTMATETFINSGQLHADGMTGGQIALEAGDILNAGPITADSSVGGAGQVHLAFTHSYVAPAASVVSASSAEGQGGQVSIDGSGTGRLYSSGRQMVTGSVGGTLNLLGNGIVLAGATVDASGQDAGGLVRIGPAVPGNDRIAASANTVLVTPASRIEASARESGSGGQVYLGADLTLSVAGTLMARGGPMGGSGGFIDVSSQGNLSYAGIADAGATLGKTGTLLLDPKNLVISAAPVGVFPQFDLIDPHPTNNGAFGQTTFVLDNGNVVVTNPKDDFGGRNAGAMYLFDGSTGALLSALVGSSTGEGVGGSVTILHNGNFLLVNPSWQGNRGAVTWGSSTTGISGVLSDANSLIGSAPGDRVGAGVDTLGNGNYLVISPSWNSFRGAVTWGDGSGGTSGTISEANSLVGTNANDLNNVQIFHVGEGNYVVLSPNWNGNRGAVTWGNGRSGVHGIISEANSLVGSNANDRIGYGPYVGVTVLSNGNYVVDSFYAGAVTWGNGNAGVSGTISPANSLVGNVGLTIVPLNNGNYVIDSPYWGDDCGAVTWANGSTGIAGVVSEANSLIGSIPQILGPHGMVIYPGDAVGGQIGAHGRFDPGITLLSNGSYLITSPNWNYATGAITWSDGKGSVTGILSVDNSLTGSSAGDQVGTTGNSLVPAIIPLNNGNYVIDSPHWGGDRGAVTWENGNAALSGTVSEASSLTGSSPGDLVGSNVGYLSPAIFPLTNGNYVVASPNWNGSRGAVTWGNGRTGTKGIVSEANSMVGSFPNDLVGRGVNNSGGVTALSNGNYVINSAHWNGASGAVTWGDGTRGVTGVVSEANSLIGSNPGDQVGAGITPLANGNYVVLSPSWNAQRGAVTWGDGIGGIEGSITDGNSLIGSSPGDQLGSTADSVTALNNGNYVVESPYWNNGRGAVTWGQGSTGTSGTITEANSLVGSNPGDSVGGWSTNSNSIFPSGLLQLSDGNFVVSSPNWNDNRGAVTWGSGSAGVRGTLSDTNSLVGSTPGDYVGAINEYGGLYPILTPLSNGNFLILSPNWNSQRGAVTWGNESTGISGSVSAGNSLVGTNSGDQVGTVGDVITFSNGNFVVFVPNWDNGRGAVAWGNGRAGIDGAVSEANSLVGSLPGDHVGALNLGNGWQPDITLLSNGDYLIGSPGWSRNRGAVTWTSGTTGQTFAGLGTLTPQNSIIGASLSASLNGILENSINHTFLASFPGADRVTVGVIAPGQLTYATALAQSLTLTPDFLARTLDTGTAVILQASNDLTVNDPIVVNAGGQGGALTLAAGRSVLLNASIATDNGPLTLIANDPLADGVVDSDRDPGPAVIRMASGTVLDTGAAALTVDLRDGAGLTNSASGPLLLQDLSAGSVSVVNQGPSPGSDLLFGNVTSRGPQSYASLHGTTCISGTFTAADNAITLRNAVLLVPGGTLDAGASTVNVTEASLTLLPGQATLSSGLVLDAATSVSATLLPGSASQLVVHGPIQLGDSTLTLLMGFTPPVGSRFEIMTNNSGVPIRGTFAGLAEGATFTAGGAVFQITYQGGSGGDSVVLTCVG